MQRRHLSKGRVTAVSGRRAGYLSRVRTPIRGAATHLQREERLQGRGGLLATFLLQQCPITCTSQLFHKLPGTHTSHGLTGTEQGLLEPDPRAGVAEDKCLLQTLPSWECGELAAAAPQKTF